jgi:alkylhydroperoxidase/carboxymuconolactone decarboxylase family protein YurZ
MNLSSQTREGGKEKKNNSNEEAEGQKSSSRGYVIPEFDRVGKSDPNFLQLIKQSSEYCLKDGKALPAKYRLMIHICLLARTGHVRGIPNHIKNAIEKYGASELELIEAFETAMVAGGVPTMIRAMGGLISYEENKG